MIDADALRSLISPSSCGLRSLSLGVDVTEHRVWPFLCTASSVPHLKLDRVKSRLKCRRSRIQAAFRGSSAWRSATMFSAMMVAPKWLHFWRCCGGEPDTVCSSRLKCFYGLLRMFRLPMSWPSFAPWPRRDCRFEWFAMWFLDARGLSS